MKKILALILAGVMLLSFAACGGNDVSEETTTQGTEQTTEPVAEDTTEATVEESTEAPASSDSGNTATDAAGLLNKVWAKFADDEKFFAMGGHFSSPVDGAAGKYDITMVEDLDGSLGLPQANAAQIDDAASLMHAMNANTFTGAAYHLTAGTDAAAFASAIESHLATRQWMCGIPETLLIVAVDGYVVTAFGANDIVSNFKTKLAGEFASAQVLVEKPNA